MRKRIAIWLQTRYVQFLRWLFRDIPLTVKADDSGNVYGFEDQHCQVHPGYQSLRNERPTSQAEMT